MVLPHPAQVSARPGDAHPPSPPRSLSLTQAGDTSAQPSGTAASHRLRLRKPADRPGGNDTVNHKDLGISWNAALEPGGVLVSEKVTLEFEVSAIRTGD